MEVLEPPGADNRATRTHRGWSFEVLPRGGETNKAIACRFVVGTCVCKRCSDAGEPNCIHQNGESAVRNGNTRSLYSDCETSLAQRFRSVKRLAARPAPYSRLGRIFRATASATQTSLLRRLRRQLADE